MWPRVLDVLKVVVVLACWTGGVILRFQPMPARVVGGGLIVLGCVLVAVWRPRR